MSAFSHERSMAKTGAADTASTPAQTILENAWPSQHKSYLNVSRWFDALDVGGVSPEWAAAVVAPLHGYLARDALVMIGSSMPSPLRELLSAMRDIVNALDAHDGRAFWHGIVALDAFWHGVDVSEDGKPTFLVDLQQAIVYGLTTTPVGQLEKAIEVSAVARAASWAEAMGETVADRIMLGMAVHVLCAESLWMHHAALTMADCIVSRVPSQASREWRVLAVRAARARPSIVTANEDNDAPAVDEALLHDSRIDATHARTRAFLTDLVAASADTPEVAGSTGPRRGNVLTWTMWVTLQGYSASGRGARAPTFPTSLEAMPSKAVARNPSYVRTSTDAHTAVVRTCGTMTERRRTIKLDVDESAGVFLITEERVVYAFA